jgi:hypothetical protein
MSVSLRPLLVYKNRVSEGTTVILTLGVGLESLNDEREPGMAVEGAANGEEFHVEH